MSRCVSFVQILYVYTNLSGQNLVDETAKITGGSLDYIIANAAVQSEWSAHNPFGVL
jgi:hypothetical protein